MDYQLIIQFPADSIVDFDSLVELEGRLIEIIGTSAHIDGHDFGSEEANIFIIASDPTDIFGLVRGELETNGLLSQCMAAYRKLDGEEYNIL